MPYQQIFILGRVGDAPTMRYTPSGVPVTSFSMAVNEKWTAEDGQRKEQTTWYRVSCWKKLAEIVNEHVTKGKEILVIGNRVEARAYTDKHGEMRASLEVTAKEIQFTGSRAEVGAEATAEGRKIAEGMGSDIDESSIPF